MLWSGRAYKELDNLASLRVYIWLDVSWSLPSYLFVISCRQNHFLYWFHNQDLKEIGTEGRQKLESLAYKILSLFSIRVLRPNSESDFLSENLTFPFLADIRKMHSFWTDSSSHLHKFAFILWAKDLKYHTVKTLQMPPRIKWRMARKWNQHSGKSVTKTRAKMQ